MTKAQENKPNLLRVAREIARCENPKRVANALLALLATEPGLIRVKGKERAE